MNEGLSVLEGFLASSRSRRLGNRLAIERMQVRYIMMSWKQPRQMILAIVTYSGRLDGEQSAIASNLLQGGI